MKIKKENVETIMALSPMQESILFQQFLMEDHIPFIEQVHLQISGILCDDHFKMAVKHVVNNNQPLRTIFRWEGLNEPVQIVLKDHMPMIDFVHLEKGEAAGCLEKFKKEHRVCLSDIQNVPFRIAVVKENQGINHLIITHHHILYDGWSNSLLLSEIFESYCKALDQSEMPNYKKGNYEEYISYIKGGNEDKKKEYWANYLSNYENENNPLFGVKNHEYLKHEIGLRKITLSESTKKGIIEYSKKNGATIASIFYAAYAVLIGELKQKSDVIFGVTISGRNVPIGGIQNTMGLFINTLPLRVNTKQSFSDIVKQINSDFRDASKEEHASLSMINKLNKKNKSSPDLLDSLMIIENYPVNMEIFKENNTLQVLEFSNHDLKASYPLTLEIRLFDEFEVLVKHMKSHFNEDEIEKIGSRYCEILQEKVFNRDANIIFEENENCSQIEQIIKGIWADVLSMDINTIERSSDFFDLGGHSIKVTNVVLRIQRTLNIKISIEEFFENTTVKQLAYLIKTKTTEVDKIAKIQDKEYYEVSAGQKRIYFLQKMDEKSTSYNMVEVMEIGSEIKNERIQEILIDIVKRHECLRSTYFESEDVVYQKIEKESEIDFKVVKDINDNKELEEVISQAIMPFDLSKGPLVRASIFEYKSGRRNFVIELHHIISDGLSNQILMREFIEALENEVTTVISNEYSIGYKDYVQWQKNRKDIILNQKAYWHKEFLEEVPILELNTDRERPDVMSHEGDRVSFSFDEMILRKLKKIAIENHSTVYNVLLSGWFVLLNKLSGQNDIVVGTVTSGRVHEETENMIGLFVNTLPMRYRFSKTETFSELIEKLTEKTLKSIENQEYPFEELVNDLKVERNIGRNPLFDNMFVMQSSEQMIKMPTYMKKVDFRRKTSKFDMTFFAEEMKDQILCEFEYNTNLFNRETVERYSKLYISIIEQIISNQKLAVIELETINANEKAFYFNEDRMAKELANDRTIHEQIDYYAVKVPEQIAIEASDENISYLELKKRSDCLSKRLMNQNIKKGDIVGVMMPNSSKLIITLLAILKTGAAYLPIDDEFPTARIAFMLRDAECRTLLVNSETEHSDFEGVKTLNIDELNDSFSESFQPVEYHLDDMMYLIYTSGSTGKPKGCSISQRGVKNYIEWASRTYFKDDKIYFPFYSSIAFDLTVTSIFAPLIVGQTVIVYHKKLDAIKDIVIDGRSNILKATPTHLKLMLDYDCSNSNIKRIIVGGEQLTTDLADKIIEKFGVGIEIYNEYGPTETVVGCMIHQYSPEHDKGSVVPIGAPIDNMQVYILDSNKKLCPIGVIGEIYVGGIGVSKGYFKKEQLTFEKFVDSPFNLSNDSKLYKTGDLGVLLSGSIIEFKGRNDNQVKIRGHRIEIDEIKHEILKYPGIKDVEIIIKAGAMSESYLCAYVVSSEVLHFSELKLYLSNHLSHYMIPTHFIQMDRIPIAPSGKTDIKLLPNPNFERKNHLEEPSNDIENFLLSIWKNTLGIEKISTEDNFFEIGGNSYLLMKMHNQISEKYASVKITDFFKYTTIKSLAEFIEDQTKENNNFILHREDFFMQMPSDFFKIEQPSHDRGKLEVILTNELWHSLRISDKKYSEQTTIVALILYIFHVMSGNEEVLIQVYLEETKRIVPMKVYVEKEKQLGYLVNELDKLLGAESGSYIPEEAVPIKMTRDENELSILIVIGKMDSRQDLLECCDITFEFKEINQQHKIEVLFDQFIISENRMSQIVNILAGMIKKRSET